MIELVQILFELSEHQSLVGVDLGHIKVIIISKCRSFCLLNQIMQEFNFFKQRN
jgi:hypothetical protein